MKRVLSWLLGLVCGGVVWVVVAHVVVAHSAAERIYERLTDVPARYVAIVLGARVHQGGQLSAVLDNRVQCAADLYRAGKVRRVLVSGDHGQRSYDEVNAMARALLARGVPKSAVFLDHAGFRTLDSMQRAQEVFSVHGATVCTQRFHLPRSLFLARHFGIDAVGFVADRREYWSALHNTLRERVAIAAALLDVLTGRSARYLGPRYPIDGDSERTHDSVSAR